MIDRTPRIAVAGNPNCGKTSLFNALTGLHQTVANYPGVTVDVISGYPEWNGVCLEVVDLPGTYSLAAYSQDEAVARDFLVHARPDVVLNVVDATNLERHLYLTTQLMELGIPVVMALNMSDVAESRGIRVDTAKLSVLLGIPVVPTVANRRIGVPEVLEACGRAAFAPAPPRPAAVTYGHPVDAEVGILALLAGADDALAAAFSPHWAAVKLIEGDEDARRHVREVTPHAALIENAAALAARRIETHYGDRAATIVAERRYGFAAGAVRACVRRAVSAPNDRTDRIDAVVCHRLAGPVILAAVAYLLFLVTFKVGEEWNWIFGRSPKGWIEDVFTWLAASAAPLRESWPMIGSFLVDGAIAGTGTVVAFAPLIFVLFFCVAVLEDSGYIARMAFVMDRPLKIFGLQGKSVLALIVAGGFGGGCAVPGVMASRTLRGERERLVTILVTPLMICGAKLSVLLLLVGAFFPGHRAGILFFLWGLSWAFTLAAAWILRRCLVRGEDAPFVLELPPYHLPTLRGAFQHTWERTWMFVKKAGTLLLAVSVVLWVMMSFPRLSPERVADFDRRTSVAPDAAMRDRVAAERREAALAGSVAGRLGRLAEPVTRLAGFSWRENIALLGGLAAKEAILGTLGTAHSLAAGPDGAGLVGHLRADPAWTRIRALALMIFVMVYSPCVATLAAVRRETGAWRWAVFSTAYTTLFAFALAVAVYQAGGVLTTLARG
ncbi:MAG: ferrous iron transport protein B [Planctomycetota bacterium]